MRPNGVYIAVLSNALSATDALLLWNLYSTTSAEMFLQLQTYFDTFKVDFSSLETRRRPLFLHRSSIISSFNRHLNKCPMFGYQRLDVKTDTLYALSHWKSIFFVFDNSEDTATAGCSNKCKRRNIAGHRESTDGKNGDIGGVSYRCANLPGIIRSREIPERRSRARNVVRGYTDGDAKVDVTRAQKLVRFKPSTITCVRRR